jgi:hypothetical protein
VQGGTRHAVGGASRTKTEVGGMDASFGVERDEVTA